MIAVSVASFASPYYFYPSAGLGGIAANGLVYSRHLSSLSHVPVSSVGGYAPVGAVPVGAVGGYPVGTVGAVGGYPVGTVGAVGGYPVGGYAPVSPVRPVAPVQAPVSPYWPYARFGPHQIAQTYLKTVEAKKFPADFDAEKCPNYPFCDHPEIPTIDASIPAVPMHDEVQLPADVSIEKCPDYPNCPIPEIPAPLL